MRNWLQTTDLKIRSRLSIYFRETEANGGHIEGTTWGVQWRYRNENKNCDIDWILIEWQTFPLICDIFIYLFMTSEVVASRGDEVSNFNDQNNFDKSYLLYKIQQIQTYE